MKFDAKLIELDDVIHIIIPKKLVHNIKLWRVGYDDKAECIAIFDDIEEAKRVREAYYADDEAARINGELVPNWRYFITTED